MKMLKTFLPAGLRPVRIPFGFYRGVRLGLDMQCELQKCLGLYEYETFRSMRRHSQGCRGVLDVGAAKGELSIRFLMTPGVEKVVAVEPGGDERRMFSANLKLNGLETDARLVIHPGFAGAGDGRDWRSLDSLAGELPSPLFIKIDIDGPEAEVLDTGVKMLTEKDCRLLIETHSPEAEEGCVERLQRFGYTTRIVDQAWWRAVIPEHRTIPHNRWLIAWQKTPVKAIR